MTAGPRIFIVDDDAALRYGLAIFLEISGYTVSAFESAENFLATCTPDVTGCAILDLEMPGMDGQTLQKEMNRRGFRLPVIFLSGYGTIRTSVRTMKAGAVNFLTKPVDPPALVACVQEALNIESRQQRRHETRLANASLLESLTERERQIMALTVTGYTNKEIAQRLDISHRTVEIHRARIFQKTNTSNALELARMAGVIDARPG